MQHTAASMRAQYRAEMVVDDDSESYQSDQESFEEVPSNQTASPEGEKRIVDQTQDITEHKL